MVVTVPKIQALAAQPRMAEALQIFVILDLSMKEANIVSGWECGTAEIGTVLFASVLEQADVAV